MQIIQTTVLLNNANRQVQRNVPVLVCVCGQCAQTTAVVSKEEMCLKTHTHTHILMNTAQNGVQVTTCKCQQWVPLQRVVINSSNSIDEMTVTVQVHVTHNSSLHLVTIFYQCEVFFLI